MSSLNTDMRMKFIMAGLLACFGIFCRSQKYLYKVVV